MNPPLSIVIPWSNRPELERTLAHNRAAFAAANAEIIVANCGGNAELLASCIAGTSYSPLRTVALEMPFNKSLALNIGAHEARGDTLFFLDADLELDPNSCTAALGLVSDECAVTLDRVIESGSLQSRAYEHLHSIVNSIELETSDGRIVRLETNRRHLQDGSRSAPGMVFLRKWRFEQVGGMNSDLAGWGWEDLDLLARLQLAVGLRIERAGTATHLSHGDDTRSIAGPHRAANESHNAAMCMANYGFGYYLGTYADDVATHCSASATAASEP